MFRNTEYTSARITFTHVRGGQLQVLHPALEFNVLMETINEIHAEVGDLTSPPSPVLINKLLEQLGGKLPQCSPPIAGGWDADRYSFVAELESKHEIRYISGYTDSVDGLELDKDAQLFINRIVVVRKATVATPTGEQQLTTLGRDTVFLRGDAGYCTLRPSDLFASMQVADFPLRGVHSEVIDMRSQFAGGALIKCHHGQLDNTTYYLKELVGAYAEARADFDALGDGGNVYGECVQKTSTSIQMSDDFVSQLMMMGETPDNLSFKLSELKEIIKFPDIEVIKVVKLPAVKRSQTAEVGSLQFYLGNLIITSIAGLLTEHGLNRVVVGYAGGSVTISEPGTLTGEPADQEILNELRDWLAVEIPLTTRLMCLSMQFTATVELFGEASVTIVLQSSNQMSAMTVDRPMWASGVWSKFITDDAAVLSRSASDTRHLLEML